MMQRKFATFTLIALAMLALVAIPVFPQDQLPSPGGWVIRSVDFAIKGSTREYYLKLAADIEIGKSFSNVELLKAYVDDRAQLIRNQRAIESASIEITYGETVADGTVPVDLHVTTADTFNIIVLPYLKYDSNNGLKLSARGRAYNFLGTLQTLAINLDYTNGVLRDSSGDPVQQWSLSNTFSLPFVAAGLDWSWSFSQSAGYIVGEPFAYSADTSVTANLPLGPGTLYITPSQSLNLNQQYASADYSQYFYYTNMVYYTSGLALSYGLPLFRHVGRFGALTYSPSTSLSSNWVPGESLDPNLSGGTFDIAQSLSFGRVDWIDNLRSGLSASLSNDNSLAMLTNIWARTLSFSVSGHTLFFPWLGASSRLSGFYRFDDLTGTGGSSLRGILDKRITTDTMLTLNVDLPIKVIHFVPSKWFGISWMRFFEFDQVWSPFFDAAIGHFDGRYFKLSDGYYSAGLEVITFPLSFRSFYMRISAGWDIAAVLETKSLSGPTPRDGRTMRELFIGLGMFY